MSAQVFISYSNQDRAVAEAIHDSLEKAGIPAWLAHRDLTSGVPWSQRIIDEIHASRVMVLILSNHANHSQYVIREVAEAVERQTSIVTVRIEDVAPSKGLKFFIAAEQWLDAFAMSKEHYHRRLIDDVRLLLNPPTADAETESAVVAGHREVTARTPAADGRLSALLREHRGAVRATLVLAGIIALAFAGMKVVASFEPDVVIATPAGQLSVGDSVQLALQSTHDSIAWSSSNSEVIGISPGSTTFRALTAGTAVLVAQAGRKADSVTFTVVSPPVGSIAVQPPPPNGIRVGDSWQFGVTAKDINGRDIASISPVWSSETPRFVSINEQGNAVGVAPGRARVRVRVDSLTETIAVTIVERPARSTDPARVTDSNRAADPPPPVTRDSPQVNLPVRPSLRATDLTQWAELCLKSLREKNVAWIESNYNPPSRTDQNNFNRLKSMMRESSYSVSGSGMLEPNVETRSMDFWAQFSYRTGMGQNLKQRATFRVIGTNANTTGTWRLDSCRVQGGFTND